MCKCDLLSVYCHGFIFIILSQMTNWRELKSIAISKYQGMLAAHSDIFFVTFDVVLKPSDDQFG